VNRPDPAKYAASIEKTQTLKVSDENARVASRKTLEAMGYEIQAFTPELHLVSTKPHAVGTPAVCDCGTWNGSDVSGAAQSTLKLTTQAVDDSVSVLKLEHTCAANMTGRNLYGGITHQETYQCASRGVVEKEFWNTLRTVIAAKVAEH
jgi:hypothetical protein